MITAKISITAAEEVSEFLDRMIPTHCPLPCVPAWEAVRDALLALSNDTDAIVTEEFEARAEEIHRDALALLAARKRQGGRS
jgi:hypothetical protein